MDIREYFHEKEMFCPESEGVQFYAFFGCIRCRVYRVGNGSWKWQTEGWVIVRSGEKKSKRAAMHAARNAVEPLMAIR